MAYGVSTRKARHLQVDNRALRYVCSSLWPPPLLSPRQVIDENADLFGFAAKCMNAKWIAN